ncbi:MAG: CAP domain-containing protein [Chloroflexi bacterium]|nr:CAP domain-containing protein [Chloroflexota bacterium]
MNYTLAKLNGRRWLPLFLLLITSLIGMVSVQQLAAKNIFSVDADPWIDTSDRQTVNDYYYTNFLPSQGIPMNWTGDYAACTPGTTSQAYRDGVLMQINYFRAMAGVPAAVTFSDTFNGKAQQAALMMSVNGTLSHSPPPSWTCYTADGAEAAGKSNLGMSYGGMPYEIAYYIDESLPSVGHRRWILYPQTMQMGTGDISESYPPYPMTNALWVMDDHIWDTRPSTRENFVAWPPPGYLPHPMVPDLWSISPTRTDFTVATVSMTMNGSPVNITDQYLFGCASQFCAPEPVIVWVPDVAWSSLDLSSDIVFHVDVTAQFPSGSPEIFNYDVILFAPSDTPPVNFTNWVYLPSILK